MKPAILIIAIILLPLSKCLAQNAAADTTPVTTLIPTDSLQQDTIVSSDSLRIDSTTAALKNKMGRHSPLKAAIFSAVLPGLGQVYNKKYWKIPIVYAGFAGFGVALYYTSYYFHGYRNAYRQQVALVPNPNASFNTYSDPATLKDLENTYKKYLDISSIGVGVWYMLTIIDAAVDAHLYEWNMRDDLSVTWAPVMLNSGFNYNTAAAGVEFTLHF